MEKRAQVISEIDEESYKVKRLIDDIERKIGKNKKGFMNMPV